MLWSAGAPGRADGQPDDTGAARRVPDRSEFGSERLRRARSDRRPSSCSSLWQIAQHLGAICSRSLLHLADISAPSFTLAVCAEKGFPRPQPDRWTSREAPYSAEACFHRGSSAHFRWPCFQMAFLAALRESLARPELRMCPHAARDNPTDARSRFLRVPVGGA